MHITKFSNETVIIADKGCYLKLKGKKTSESIIGKPTRIFFSNKGDIPELEDVLMNPEVKE